MYLFIWDSFLQDVNCVLSDFLIRIFGLCFADLDTSFEYFWTLTCYQIECANIFLPSVSCLFIFFLHYADF